MVRTIVIAIRGWTTTGDWLLGGRPGGEFPANALGALAAELRASEVWAPDLDIPMFSMRNVEDVAHDLFQQIATKLATMPYVEEVILLGYSAGSLLARRIFCMAHGVNAAGQIVPADAVWWASRVHRLVVLSGITRGWEFSTASPDHVRFLSPVLLGVARFVGWCKSIAASPGRKLPFIWQIKRGSPFVVSTRIQYVTLMARLRRDCADGAVTALSHPMRSGGLPTTVFLLGARDEYISPTDCTELGPRDEFAYVELDGSNHTEALLFAGIDPAACARRSRIVDSIALDFDELRRKPWALYPGDIDDYLDPMDLSEGGREVADRNDRVEHAVMVVHGIRDNGFWTKRVAREIKVLGRQKNIEVRAPSPSYGFFSMWDFVKPNGRKNATYWFMERYADVRSHFPNATISFVGHSNGTYIAAHAMQLCPAITFDRVVFAGSVVRRNYEWHLRSGQANEVLNYVGDADGVVAFLPAVFEFLRLRWLDVGGAGAFGFRAAEPVPEARKCVTPPGTAPVYLTELRFVRGGHGAAISEDFWPEIASFVLQDQNSQRQPVGRGRRIAALFRFAPAVTLAGVGIALCVLFLPLLVAAALAAAALDSVPAASQVFWSLSVIAMLALSMAISWLAGRFLKAW